MNTGRNHIILNIGLGCTVILNLILISVLIVVLVGKVPTNYKLIGWGTINLIVLIAAYLIYNMVFIYAFHLLNIKTFTIITFGIFVSSPLTSSLFAYLQIQIIGISEDNVLFIGLIAFAFIFFQFFSINNELWYMFQFYPISRIIFFVLILVLSLTSVKPFAILFTTMILLVAYDTVFLYKIRNLLSKKATIAKDHIDLLD